MNFSIIVVSLFGFSHLSHTFFVGCFSGSLLAALGAYANEITAAEYVWVCWPLLGFTTTCKVLFYKLVF